MRRQIIKTLLVLLTGTILLFQQVEAGNPFSRFLNNVTNSTNNNQDSLGNWGGMVKQPGVRDYPVLITINELSINKIAGTWKFPTMGCSGSLLLTGTQRDIFVFQGNVMHGKDKCQEGGQVRMKQSGPGQQRWEWYHPNGKRGLYAVLGKNVTPPSANIPSGTVIKAANMRTGPGSSNAIITVVPKGTAVDLTAKQGKWYMVRANIKGVPTDGWIYSSIISVDSSQAAKLPQGAGSDKATGDQTQQNIEYIGYSKDFMPIKKMLMDGKLDDIEKFYLEQEEAAKKETSKESDVIERVGFLRWLERGTLAIDQGKNDVAVNDFSSAEMLLDAKGNESKAGGFFKNIFNTGAEFLTGNEEISDYSGNGWEKILMLNYKSIAYLLQGDRRAYNVTRRAIDWQNIEKKIFDKKLHEEKEKLSKEIENKNDEKQETSEQDIKSGLAKAFAPMEAKAKSVPSAYVNPFGFYVAGMIQEFESYSDRSLRDNARISYKKALELNPESKVLIKAVKDLKKPQAPSGTNLVHVIVADGFVPEKKVLTHNVTTKNGIVPLKLPIYTPVATKVHRIEVQTTSGKRIATLSPVADIEAICLRQQKDMQPVLTMRAMASFLVAGVMESTAQQSQGVGGSVLKIVSKARNNNSAPDTRSWMSLPSTIQAARLHLRKGTKRLKIVTYDKRGKKLATQVFRLDPNMHGIVYARSIGKTLYTQSAEKLWIAEL